MTATFTVFVCSTFIDLTHEREVVLDAIGRLKAQHGSMEYFGARTTQPIETCLEEVRASDALVVIVGHRYGSIVEELGISYSEAEYAEGFRLRKPCLVYLRDDDTPILPRHVESNPGKQGLLDAWKTTLQSRHTVAKFQDGARLAVQVAADLSRTLRDLDDVAKARAAARTNSATTLSAEVSGVLLEALDRGVPEASLISAFRSAVSSLLATMRKREATVFLSYARADFDIVARVGKRLVSAGIRVWLDQTSLEGGTDWMQELERELSEADFVAFFISPHSITSGWAMRELQVALHRQVSGEGGGAILPILLRDADVPPLLRQFQWIDLRDGDAERAAELVLDAIHRTSGRRTS